MLSGFNTNFRYRGILFHVQTEDSGRENPHVITHLFHGGNIIASIKQEYSALLVEEDIESAVKKLMEGQHKAILKQLSRGEHDRAIAERLGPDIFHAAMSEVETEAENSAYIGDSLRADYQGASELGMTAYLIDPDRAAEVPDHARLSSILELERALADGSPAT